MAKIPTTNGNSATHPMPGTVATLPAPVASTGAWPSDLSGTVEGTLKPETSAPAIGGLNSAMNAAMQQQPATGAARASNPMAGMSLLKGKNFSEVSDGGRLLRVADENGEKIEYEAQIVKAEFRTAANGSENINLQLKTTFPTRDAGITIYDNLSLVDAALWRAKSLMRATQTLSEDGQTFIAADISEFVGHIVRFTIRHDEYQGKTNNRIDGAFMEAFQTPELNTPPF